MKTIITYLILLSLTGCCKLFDKNCPCEDVTINSLDDAALAALNDPQGFDDYVAQRASDFDSHFYDCAQNRINEMTKISNERKDFCDEAHTQGSDFWHRCYSEVEQEVDNGIVFLNDILSVTRGTKLFQETSTGITMIFFKTTEPALYNEFVAIINDLWEEATAGNTCKVCI